MGREEKEYTPYIFNDNRDDHNAADNDDDDGDGG